MPLDLAKIHRLAAPTLVDGKWRKPVMSRMEVSQVKKLALIAGVKWVDPPSMVVKPKPIEFARMKGVQHDRRMEQRILKTRELMVGQQKKWAEIHKVRRDKLKAKEKDKKLFDFNDYLKPVITPEAQISRWDTLELEKFHENKALIQRKENYWAGLLKGSTGVAKKLSGEERLAKKRAERQQRKKDRADAKEAKSGVNQGDDDEVVIKPKKTEGKDGVKEEKKDEQKVKEDKEKSKDEKKVKEDKDKSKEDKDKTKEAKKDKKEAKELKETVKEDAKKAADKGEEKAKKIKEKPKPEGS